MDRIGKCTKQCSSSGDTVNTVYLLYANMLMYSAISLRLQPNSALKLRYDKQDILYSCTNKNSRYRCFKLTYKEYIASIVIKFLAFYKSHFGYYLLT